LSVSLLADCTGEIETFSKHLLSSFIRFCARRNRRRSIRPLGSLHLKWGHRGEQARRYNFHSPEKSCRLKPCSGLAFLELAKGFEPPTL
jgi:hypothetical protein